VKQATRKRLFGFAKSARRKLALWLSTATVAGVAVYYVGTMVVRRIRSAINASPSTPKPAEAPVAPEPMNARIAAKTPEDVSETPPTSTIPGLAEMLDPGVWKCPDRTTAAQLLGSIEGHTYHRPSCRWAKNIRDENRICFANIQTAEDRGYNPCSTCKPA